MNRGRLLSVSQGNYIGSIPPYGYEKTTIRDGKRKCPTLKIKEDEANIVRIIFDMYVNKNMGYKKIADYLDENGVTPPKGERWSPNAIKDILINIHYIGKVKWNRRKTEIHVSLLFRRTFLTLPLKNAAAIQEPRLRHKSATLLPDLYTVSAAVP